MRVLEQHGICGSHSEAPGPSAPVRMAAVHSSTTTSALAPGTVGLESRWSLGLSSRSTVEEGVEDLMDGGHFHGRTKLGI